ncbi:MAG: hypothetical protein Q8K28_10600 [Hoeflea sp.]|uniref:hypothetical protein n=1 Tax=Hoeflea sp. TaxID=1940281 RepID=UPI00272EFFD4|nr:hypothetical protein [Hoeflea sp.]MDP2120342.1 hypothetical protein [Hoeflea sp.]
MMMNSAPSRAFRIFLAITLTLGLFVSAVGISMSHSAVNAEAAEQMRQAELASADDHGHSHDDGELEEQRAGHSHGHNPADHSHETPHLAGQLYLAYRDKNRIHFASIPETIELGGSFRLDRPPKPVSLI